MDSQVSCHVSVGDRVEANEQYRGTVQFVGDISELGHGIFIGIDLDSPIAGGNDGSTNSGNRYFFSSKGHGMFADIQHVNKIESGLNTVNDSGGGVMNDSPFDYSYDAAAAFNDDGYDAISSMDEISRKLQKQLRRRPSQFDLEAQGVVPPNYFIDPIQATKTAHDSHAMIAHHLSTHLQSRPTTDEIEQLNIVPFNYFSDAMEVSNDHDHITNHSKSSTITDVGDMHIIPHHYLDQLLEDAVTHHNRKQSRMGHVQKRLEKHLPSPVAHTLAHTLISSVQDSPVLLQDIEYEHNSRPEEVNDDGQEWQISFVYGEYEPMENFIPMNAAQTVNVKDTLERRLSLRPSQQQIEVWGFVPPQYFESPEQSFLRQALGREIALDLLEGFLPNREDINELTNRGIMHFDFIDKDHQQAMSEEHQRKQSVIEELTEKLDPRRRPSVMDLGDAGLIPENWLLDLYGLADEVRRRHQRMDSAVNDLKSHLNVPPVLADVVARDLLDEIETVDPYLDQGTMNNAEHRSRNSTDDMDINGNQPSPLLLQNNEVLVSMQLQLEQLQMEVSQKSRELIFKDDQISKLQTIEHNSMQTISKITKENNKIEDSMNELQNENTILKQEKHILSRNVCRLQSQQMSEMQRLDWKATEIELDAERMKTKQMKEEQTKCILQLQSSDIKISKLENDIKQMTENKMVLIKQTTEQMNILRSYIVSYQRFYKTHTHNSNKSNAYSFVSKLFQLS